MPALRDRLRTLLQSSNQQAIWSPWFIGTLLGFVIAAGILPGGFDAGTFYLRPWFARSTAPAWTAFITEPLGWLPWPLGWQVWTLLTVLGLRYAGHWLGVRRWWIALFSFPVLANIWLGQIELFPAVGLGLAWLVLNGKLPGWWLGVGWLALAAKPQAGLGLMLLLTWWVYREQGLHTLLKAGVVAAGIGGVSLLLWPGWPVIWLERLQSLGPTRRLFNAAIMPWGLLGWPVALLPVKMSRLRRVRMVAAATLLGSPYFALYHVTTLMIVTPYGWALPASFVPLIGIILYDNWGTWIWTLVAAVLVVDAIVAVREAAVPGWWPGAERRYPSVEGD